MFISGQIFLTRQLFSSLAAEPRARGDCGLPLLLILLRVSTKSILRPVLPCTCALAACRIWEAPLSLSAILSSLLFLLPGLVASGLAAAAVKDVYQRRVRTGWVSLEGGGAIIAPLLQRCRVIAQSALFALAGLLLELPVSPPKGIGHHLPPVVARGPQVGRVVVVGTTPH